MRSDSRPTGHFGYVAAVLALAHSAGVDSRPRHPAHVGCSQNEDSLVRQDIRLRVAILATCVTDRVAN
jgi:hypothetical protein